MVMLYRYHSSVCLAIEYIRVYEDEVTRYESMLRGVPHTKTLPFGSKWEIVESQFSDSLSDDKLTKATRSRALSEPAIKLETATYLKEFNNIINGSNLHDKDKQDVKLNKLDAPNSQKYAKQNKRRTTHISMELAQYRVNASEMEHRLAEMKLKKNKRTKDDQTPNERSTLNKVPVNKESEPSMSTSLSDSALSTVRTTDTIDEEDDETEGIDTDDYRRPTSSSESCYHTKTGDDNSIYYAKSQL
ncbi:unnamed protein product [Trichobilharzia regenti]|nr:unnamed protein product [Trichobilharzia regenti]